MSITDSEIHKVLDDGNAAFGDAIATIKKHGGLASPELLASLQASFEVLTALTRSFLADR